jgi:hypothetical protein
MLGHTPTPTPAPGPGAVPDQLVYIIRHTELARGTSSDAGQYSRALVCPQCGELWGRLFQPLHPDWRATDAGCPDCEPVENSPWYVAGSFIGALRIRAAALGQDYDWETHLPPAVLRREARLHLLWWQSEYGLTWRARG